MGSFFSLLLLAFAVSLDNFSTGLAYGIKQMKLPLKSVVILSCCSGVALLLAMMIGRLFGQILSPHLASLIGGIILIGLGAWALFPLFRSHQKDEEELPHEKMIFKLELKSVGLVISILKTPTKADFDRSGTITGLEAVMLGIALSLDAFGAGLGAAMLGYSPVFIRIRCHYESNICFCRAEDGVRIFQEAMGAKINVSPRIAVNVNWILENWLKET